MRQHFDGKTGRWLVPHTPEEARDETLRAVEANRRWLRDQVWWRRWQRAAVDRFWLTIEQLKARTQRSAPSTRR